MEGGKSDFVLNCYLVSIVDYALEVLVRSYWDMVDGVNVRYDVKLLHVALTLPRGHHPNSVRIWLITLVGVASTLLGLGNNSFAYWFSGIPHTGMIALTTPFMKYNFAQNKIVRLALRFTCRLCVLLKLNECMWVSTV
jgi:hypothetical protein